MMAKASFLQKIHNQRYLFTVVVFLSLHLVIWTLLPTLLRQTVSHDAIESFVWAQHLAWGYDKNPYFIAWLTRFSLWCCGYAVNAWGYYLLQQLCVVIGLFYVWRLANRLFNPTTAMLACLMMLGCLYFSAYVENNNDNFALLLTLPMAAFYFYRAVMQQKTSDWAMTGICLGLALVSKYSALLFAAALFCYLCLSKARLRAAFSHKGLYFAVLLALIIVLPNAIWLMQHQGLTIHYLLARRSDGQLGFWASHLGNPLRFLANNGLNLLLPLLLLISHYPLSCFSRQEKTQQAAARRYAFVIAFLPLLLVFLLALLRGWKLYWEWAVPFIPFLGLGLLAWRRPQASVRAWRRFVILLAVVQLLTASIYALMVLKINAGRATANYPASAIAKRVTAIWWQHFHRPLAFVAGSRYVAGYVRYYSPDKPKVFAEWQLAYSPGVSLSALCRNGAVFLQDGYYGTTVFHLPPGYQRPSVFPESVSQRFPSLKLLPMETFHYYGGGKKARKVHLLIGLLAPNSC